MNIEKARKIDYWIGIPLCLLAGSLNFIQKILGFKKNETEPVKKVLFIKLSELGAIILSYPLINRIKNEYPSAELFFITFNRNKEVFKLLGEIIPQENILEIRETPMNFVLDSLKAVKRLRKEKIDIVFDLEFFSRISAIFSYLVRAEKIAGFYRYTFEGLYRGKFLTHKILYNPLNHIAKNYLSLSQEVKKKEKDTPSLAESIDDAELCFPEYIPGNETNNKMLVKLKNLGIQARTNRLFLINPGEGVLPLREWPIDNFISLSKSILENEDNYVIIIGTEDASEKAALILESTNGPRCISLVGQTGLEELLSLFNIADTLISNDCGLAHLAMLAPIKKFIIFGPESPQVFGPLGDKIWILYSHWPCSPCLSIFNHRNSVCKDNKCLQMINPESICRLIFDTDKQKT